MTRGWGARLRKAGWIGVFSAYGVLAAVETPLAQDVGGLFCRLERVERDLMVLQRQVYRDQAAGGGESAVSAEGSASLFVRITQLEEQIRDLTGQIEEMSYKIDQTNQRMDRMTADTEFRFQSMEKGGVAVEPPPPERQGSGPTVSEMGQVPAKTAAQGSAPVQLKPPPTDAAEAYREAFRLLHKADYAAAEVAFKAFLKDHADTEYAGNAQYWLGETYYVRGQFEPAAVAFADGYKKYRKGPKAADSLLKLGFSMRKFNQSEKACAALDQLLKEYPNTAKAQQDLAKKTRGEMKCR